MTDILDFCIDFNVELSKVKIENIIIQFGFERPRVVNIFQL